MYININKEWFKKNEQKLIDASDENDSYQIEISDTVPELSELSEKNELFLTESTKEIYVSMDYTPKSETIVSLVENAIDDIHGDEFVSIIELVVKKLNKFKSLIESVRGL